MFKKVAEYVIQECIEEKKEEIAEIKAQYEEKNSRLIELRKTTESISESMTNKEKHDNVSREDIIKEVLAYFDKEDKELNTILKSLGIKSKGLKRNEKVSIILTIKEQNFFNKE